ncbi:MAG: dipicolinate synthase subunit B [Clostridia bacterium]|nr:dipicolinate synthase subunit B [Clostridia bacterium]
MIGYAFCGSFCTLSHSLAALRRLCADGHEVLPIFSDNVYSTDTRFWKASEFADAVRALCGREIVHSIVDAEPLGPQTPLEALVIAPCTGNTLAKLAQGITDTPVTMAAKAHLREDRPLLVALASNDSMSANLANISTLLLRKQVFFVPMRQDDPERKPHSLVADFTYLSDCLSAALCGKQLRPLFL